MTTWSKALVTGASSGIGEAIARRLAGESTELVVVARNQEGLQDLADEVTVDVEVLPADLSKADDVSTVEARIEKGDIDLLVNNAGFGLNGRFIDNDRQVEADMIAVNVTALQRLTHAAATVMATAGRGGILNVASVAGFVATAESATYSATKAFVVSFSDAVHTELADSGVTVTALCPGLTRTEFQDRGGFDMTKMPDAAWQTAEEVAEAGLKAVADGRRIEVPGFQNKVMVAATKVMPSPVVRWVTDKFGD